MPACIALSSRASWMTTPVLACGRTVHGCTVGDGRAVEEEWLRRHED
jgi:hypothetical protein